MSKTLDQCRKETGEYLIEHEGLTSEFDMSINDISREAIEAMKREYGVCYLGKINLYGEERKKEYKMVEYTGQKVYNFDYAFCLPCYDAELERMINERDKAPYTGTAGDMPRVEAITDRINELNGKHLFWA